MGGAGEAPPVTSSRPRIPTDKRFRWMLGLLCVLLIGASAARVVRYSSWYEERRFSRLPLSHLEREYRKLGDENPILLYYLGRRLNQQQRFAEAVPILEQAVLLDPETPRLRDEWARALLGDGRTTVAFGQLRQFAGTNPRSAPAHLILGKFYLTQRSLERAEEELERAVKLAPSLAEGWSHLASTRLALKKIEKAHAAAETAVRLKPDNQANHLMLAALLARMNRQDEARQVYEQAVALPTAGALLHREYAVWLLSAGTRSGDVALAEAEARRALALDSNDFAAHLALGRALARAGKDTLAIEPLRRAATLAADDPAPALALSHSLHRARHTEKARQWKRVYLTRQAASSERSLLFESLRINPNSPALNRRMARLRARVGDVAATVRHHARALRRAPDSVPALVAAANELTDAGHGDKALALARKALETGKINPAVQEALGNAYLATNQGSLANRHYAEAVNLNPHRRSFLERKMKQYFARRAANPPPGELAYRKARRLAEASTGGGSGAASDAVERLARKAVDLEPTNPDFLRYLMRVQMARKNNDLAVQTAGRLLSIAPEDAEAHALLGMLLVEKADEPEEYAVIEEHLKAAAADPSVASSRYLGLGLLALKRQQGDKAVRALRKAARLEPSSKTIRYQLARAEKMAGISSTR